MDRATRDSIVSGYETLIPSLNLPDADDRPVLAAAIVGRCDVIVTQNWKDFPDEALSPFGIDVQHPDDFLCNHLNLASQLVCGAVRKVRLRLKNPYMHWEMFYREFDRVRQTTQRMESK